MNESNFNGMSNVNQQPVTPVVPQAPVEQAVPAAPVMPQGQPAPVAPVAPRQPMDKKDIMKWIGVGCGLAIVVSVFLPFMSAGGDSVSLFDADFGLKISRFIVIILGLVAAVTHFFQKAKQLSYLTSAYVLGLIISVNEIIEASFGPFASSLDNGFGWYILLLASLGIIVLNIMDDMDELKSLFGTMKTAVPSPAAAPVAPVVPAAPVAPAAQAVPAAPVMPQVQPDPVASSAPQVAPVDQVIQPTVMCTNCGQIKKNPSDQFCQGCGQRY